MIINREEATLVIKIRDINDHAPKFYDCASYSQIARVEEEKPVGTAVIQVEAKDSDKGENGEGNWIIFLLQSFFKIILKYFHFVTRFYHFFPIHL